MLHVELKINVSKFNERPLVKVEKKKKTMNMHINLIWLLTFIEHKLIALQARLHVEKIKSVDFVVNFNTSSFRN